MLLKDIINLALLFIAVKLMLTHGNPVDNWSELCSVFSWVAKVASVATTSIALTLFLFNPFFNIFVFFFFCMT